MDISISEKRLEDYLFDHLNGTNIINGVSEDISPVTDGCVYRQVNLNSYGVADLVVVNGQSHVDPAITIYELKKDEITPAALLQVMKYYTGFKNFYDWLDGEFQDGDLRCVLIGRCVSSICDFRVALSALNFLDVYLYDLCPNRGLILKYIEFDTIETFPPDIVYEILKKYDYNTHDLEAMLYMYEKGGR